MRAAAAARLASSSLRLALTAAAPSPFCAAQCGAARHGGAGEWWEATREGVGARPAAAGPGVDPPTSSPTPQAALNHPAHPPWPPPSPPSPFPWPPAPAASALQTEGPWMQGDTGTGRGWVRTGSRPHRAWPPAVEHAPPWRPGPPNPGAPAGQCTPFPVPSRRGHRTHRLGVLALVILVQLLIDAVVAGHPPQPVQQRLADLLAAQRSRAAGQAHAEGGEGHGSRAGSGCSSVLEAGGRCRQRRLTHTVTSMSGSTLMASAASSPFSTSSRMVVYRHLPACGVQGMWQQGREGGSVGAAAEQRRMVACASSGGTAARSKLAALHPASSRQPAHHTHIVKPRNRAVVGEKLCGTLLLQRRVARLAAGLGLGRHAGPYPSARLCLRPAT